MTRVSARLTGMMAICGFDTVVVGDAISALRPASDDGIELIIMDLDDPGKGGRAARPHRVGMLGPRAPPVIA